VVGGIEVLQVDLVEWDEGSLQGNLLVVDLIDLEHRTEPFSVHFDHYFYSIERKCENNVQIDSYFLDLA
jgi:hypothetical protein